MTIQFTITLSKRTVAAFRQVEDCEDDAAIAEVLKEALKDKVEEVKDQYDPADDETEDDRGEGT